MPVIGVRERDTGQIRAHPIDHVDKPTLGAFVVENTDPGAIVYSDEHSGYQGIPRRHFTFCHSLRLYTNGRVHTNGIESVWACLKRMHKGTYHWWSRKHLHRYVNECCGRLNSRSISMLERLGELVRRMEGKRLRYGELTST